MGSYLRASLLKGGADHRDPGGPLYGYCTDIGGEITPTWFRCELERNLTISDVALEHRAPAQAEDIP